jgi:cell division protein FtsX
MRNPFYKWFGASIAVVAIVLMSMVLVLLGHGAVIAYPLQILFQVIPLVLYVVLPLVLVVAACRWAAAMLGEIRALRKDLDEIAGTRDREHLPR